LGVAKGSKAILPYTKVSVSSPSRRILISTGLTLLLMAGSATFSNNNEASGLIADLYGGFPCNGWCSFDVKTEEWTYSIIYQLYGEPNGRGGVQLDNIALNYPDKSLEIDITTNQSGVLTILLQRNLVQATDGQGREIKYSVLVDGTELEYPLFWEKNDPQSGKVVESDFELFKGEPYDARILQIPFTKDAKQIEIVGTWMRDVYGSGSVQNNLPCDRLQDNCTIQLSDSKAIGNRTFDIRYTIGSSEVKSNPESMTVNDIYIDWAEKALIIETTANQSGYLAVILPEQVIHSWDSQIKPSNEQGELTSYQDFWIRRNFGTGSDVKHYNLIGQEERLLNISLSKGTFEIQISGTGIIGGDKIPDELFPGLFPSSCIDRCTYHLKVGNQTFPINYYISSFRAVQDSREPIMKAMRFDNGTNSLIIDIEANQRGKGGISLYLPYEFIESSFPNSTTNQFEVYVDGLRGTDYRLEYYGIEGNVHDSVTYQDANSFPPTPSGERLRIIGVDFDSGAKQIAIKDSAEAPKLLAKPNLGQALDDSYWTVNFPFVLGIGAAIAGIIAFITLRKRR
jgi:hypothetical protein